MFLESLMACTAKPLKMRGMAFAGVRMPNGKVLQPRLPEQALGGA